jgi:hypothetical protein
LILLNCHLKRIQWTTGNTILMGHLGRVQTSMQRSLRLIDTTVSSRHTIKRKTRMITP